MDIYPNIFKVEKVKSRYQRWIKAIWNSRLVRHKHNSWFSITWKSSLRVCGKTLCVLLCAPAFCVSCVLCVCVLCPVFVRRARALLGSLQEGSVCVLCSHILCVLCVLCLAFCVFVRRALIGGFLQGSVCVFCSGILCVLRSHILCVLCVLCLALSLQELLLEGLFSRRLCVCPMLPDFVCSMSCVCVCLPCVLCMCVCPVSCVCFLCPVFFWRIFARRLCVCPVLPSAGKLCIPCESPTPASGGLLQQIRSRKLSIKNNLWCHQRAFTIWKLPIWGEKKQPMICKSLTYLPCLELLRKLI